MTIFLHSRTLDAPSYMNTESQFSQNLLLLSYLVPNLTFRYKFPKTISRVSGSVGGLTIFSIKICSSLDIAAIEIYNIRLWCHSSLMPSYSIGKCFIIFAEDLKVMSPHAQNLFCSYFLYSFFNKLHSCVCLQAYLFSSCIWAQLTFQ